MQGVLGNEQVPIAYISMEIPSQALVHTFTKESDLIFILEHFISLFSLRFIVSPVLEKIKLQEQNLVKPNPF